MSKPHVLAFLLMAVPHWLCSAQIAEESWDNLRQLRAGEKIEVVDAKMKSYTGEFATYTPEAISLRGRGRDLTVARAEVASVKRRGESHRGRNILLGAAIGAAAGLAGAAIHGKTYHEAGETTVFMMVWTPIGAGLGTLAGAAIPARGAVTVYRAGRLRR
jgi:hypothetical protein